MKFMRWFHRKPEPAPHGPTPEQLRANRSRALSQMLELLSSRKGKTTNSVYGKSVAYKLPEPPPGAIPAGTHGMAQDSALGSLYQYAAQVGSSAYGNASGVGFLGYPFLAELAQRAEFRKMSETIARELTRKWVKLAATGDGDKSDKIALIEQAMQDHKVREKFHKCAELDGFFGISHLFIDTGDNDNPGELETPLFRNELKIKKGGLKGFTVIEPIWTYPNDYNSNDPLARNFMRPQTWFVMGKKVHTSRLLTFISREVPDLLKPAYAFGGLSLTQQAIEYVDNWLRTRQSVSDLVHSFSIMQLATNLAASLNAGAGDELDKRAQVFNGYRDNQSLMLVDKETEELSNVSVPLSGLDHLQAQSQEQMSSVCSIPLVKLLGITPSGLNASSDGEIRTFYDAIHAMQEAFLAQHLRVVLDIIQLSLFGEIDEEIGFTFNPLWQLDEAGQAAVRKTDADTDAVLIEAGVIAPEESRKRVASALETPYAGLDVDDTPEPPESDDVGNASDPSGSVARQGMEGANTAANSGV